jgi:hypothetical protein
VTSTRAFHRLELALAVLGLTAASLALLIAMDALQFHAAALWHAVRHLTIERLELHGVLLLALGIADAVVIARAVRSLVRQVLAQRAFLRALPIRSCLDVDGELVRVFPGRRVEAFCGGLLHPSVYVSTGALRGVEEPELRAILAHERHHRVRRDPLRFLLARVVSDAFRPLPPLATLADRHVSLADLAADAAAVRALGDVRPLAAAFVRLDELASSGQGGVAPERVDHLVRQGPPESVSPWLLLGAWLALGSIAGLAVPMFVLGWHPEPTVPLALELAVMTVVCVPAYLAARRADACLRPMR